MQIVIQYANIDFCQQECSRSVSDRGFSSLEECRAGTRGNNCMLVFRSTDGGYSYHNCTAAKQYSSAAYLPSEWAYGSTYSAKFFIEKEAFR